MEKPGELRFVPLTILNRFYDDKTLGKTRLASVYYYFYFDSDITLVFVSNKSSFS